MSDALPIRLKLAAAASLLASLVLLATALIISSLTAIRAVTFVNWSLFIVTSYFALLPVPRWGTFSSADRTRLIVWLAVFLAFTTASWSAVFTRE
jgi:hypothetical protein